MTSPPPRARTGARDELVRRQRALANLWAKVGVIGRQPRTASGDEPPTDQVTVAAANEFGTTRIPERSFIRSTVELRRRDLREVVRSVTREVMTGRLEPRRAADVLGQWMQAAIRDRIVELDTPPNAPETIAAKGSSNPLIDTGQLRQAITYQVETGKRPQGGA